MHAVTADDSNIENNGEKRNGLRAMGGIINRQSAAAKNQASAWRHDIERRNGEENRRMKERVRQMKIINDE